MSLIEWLVIGGLLVIFVLAGYAARLWYQVWRQRQRQTLQREERNARLAGDIRFLAQALLEGQVPLIEGAIRIKVLLDNYTGARAANVNVDVFETVFDATAHIPTHQAWKALPPAQRRQYEQDMLNLEQQHAEQLRGAAQSLRNGLPSKSGV
ncbi:MAG: DUF2489 domain-containing protein [Pseudomonas sp.]